MGPGFDQEMHQACGHSRVESVNMKNPQHTGWFKCPFTICSHFHPFSYFHIPQESITLLNYVLLGTDAHTTHSGRATSASPTHRTYCSVPFLPSAVTAALYSSWEGREMTPLRAIHQGNKCSVLLLSSIKVHLHAEAKQSFSMHSFFVSTYTLP